MSDDGMGLDIAALHAEVEKQRAIVESGRPLTPLELVRVASLSLMLTDSLGELQSNLATTMRALLEQREQIESLEARLAALE